MSRTPEKIMCWALYAALAYCAVRYVIFLYAFFGA